MKVWQGPGQGVLTSGVFVTASTASARTAQPPMAASTASVASTASSTAGERFVAAGVGAAVAETITLPVDATKTRLQMQATVAGGGGAVRYTGLLQGMYRIGVDDGAAALWRGFQPALCAATLRTAGSNR